MKHAKPYRSAHISAVTVAVMSMAIIVPLSSNATSNCAEGWEERSVFSYQCDLILQGDSVVTVPEGVTSLDYILIGGGGGGGAGGTGGAQIPLAGGGGGAGGIVSGDFDVSAGETLTITIGSGGSGGTYTSGSGGTNGSAGTVTSLISDSITVEAMPGLGGNSGDATSNPGKGGDSGNGFSGGLGYNSDGLSAGGGGGGSTANGVDGDLNNGGNGGFGEELSLEGGFATDWTDVNVLRDGSQTYVGADDYFHPRILFSGIGFGGGGGVTTHYENPPYCGSIPPDDPLGYAAQPGDYSSWDGHGACAYTDGSYGAIAALGEATAYPGQGGTGGAGVGTDPWSSAGSNGVPGIAWLTYSWYVAPTYTNTVSADPSSVPEFEFAQVSWDADPYFVAAAFIDDSLVDWGYIDNNPFPSYQSRLYWDYQATREGFQGAPPACGSDMTVTLRVIDPSSSFNPDNVDIKTPYEHSLDIVFEGSCAASDLDFTIEGNNDFSGSAWDTVINSNRGTHPASFSINDWDGGSLTDDAFDDFGYIYIDSTPVVPDLANCEYFANESQLQPSTWQELGSFTSFSLMCSDIEVQAGEGFVTLSVEQRFQGSFAGWYVYQTGSTGSPVPYEVMIGGASSDEYTMVGGPVSTPGLKTFMTYGDDGDPIIGYRSTEGFSVNGTNGTESIWFTSPAISDTSSGDTPVFDFEVFLTDYETNFKQTAIDLTTSLLSQDVGFGFCIATVTSAEASEVNQCGTVQPERASSAPYTGPVLSTFSSRTLDVCTPKSITITGSRLTDAVPTIQGKSLTVLENTDTKLVIAFPAGLTPSNNVDLVIDSAAGTLTHQDVFDIPDETCSIESSKGRWTQLQADGKTVKVYAKNPIGDGKIQFFVDGIEIAWVNAVDEADPKLSYASGNPYFVRSVELKPGKNRFEIKLDGVRVWRATYVPKG